MRRVRRVMSLALLVLLLGAPLAGFGYERWAVARDARQFPPPGQMIDVGDRRLHLLCLGQGDPVVLFEGSGFGNSTSASAAREALAAETRVCSYDRRGTGWSDPSPREISVGMLADDLRRLQDAASLSRQLIIVAASIGGLVTELFARRYPDRVAGLVFLDAATSDLFAIADRFDTTGVRMACTATRLAGGVGLVRLLDPFRLRDRQSEDAARSAAIVYGTKPWNAMCSLLRARAISRREFEQAGQLRDDVPLIVLTAERDSGLVPPRLAGYVDVAAIRAHRQSAHEALSRRSTLGISRRVAGSDHLIASSQPQAVVDAVQLMLPRIRAASPTR